MGLLTGRGASARVEIFSTGLELAIANFRRFCTSELKVTGAT